jgi:anti-sigma regulatory factor (Ser/Thr protein kinase)
MGLRWRISQRANRLRLRKRKLRRLKRAQRKTPYLRSRAKNIPELAGVLETHEIVCPVSLDLVANVVETSEFLHLIHRGIAARSARRVRIDFRPLQNVTPAAALALIVTMVRDTELHPDIDIRFFKPVAPEASGLLSQVGFYDYTETLKTDISIGGTKSFWKHRRGKGVQQVAAKELIKFLTPTPIPEPVLLYEALVEGMQNTAEHAYQDATIRNKDQSWWLLGYHDTTRREISFCFYDQGQGIPVTIRTRFKDRIPLLQDPGSELIRKAVVEGHYSRTKKKERGRGLPTLKRYIDAANDGELVIFSRGSRCIFRHAEEPECSEFDTPLQGTLISWRISL